MSRVNDLKKTVFYEMLNLAGRAFVVVRYSENVVIGARGFTEDEMRNGIVLVFNEKMNFSWDEGGISASLVFGTAPQKCFIPLDDIVAIYSPELQAEFVSAPQTKEAGEEKDRKPASPRKDRRPPDDSKVVKVDFQKKKKDV